MFTLIIGASASGKSEYAERFVQSLDGERIYVATMEPFGEEARERIVRHHAMRRERGFETLERYTDLSGLCVPENGNMLLEDLGNLLANELFRPDGKGEEAVLAGVFSLKERCRHLTMVSNEVFSGGRDYGEDTLRYLEKLARINRKLADQADRVVESVCGLPNVLKEGKKE